MYWPSAKGCGCCVGPGQKCIGLRPRAVAVVVGSGVQALLVRNNWPLPGGHGQYSLGGRGRGVFFWVLYRSILWNIIGALWPQGLQPCGLLLSVLGLRPKPQGGYSETFSLGRQTSLYWGCAPNPLYSLRLVWSACCWGGAVVITGEESPDPSLYMIRYLIYYR